MSLLTVSARLECDECGEIFIVHLDPATEGSVFYRPSLSDLVDDHVRNGQGLVSHLYGATSMQDEKHLCPDCTEAARAKENADEAD